MQRPCDVCGEIYEAKRATSKYCSDRCKMRKARGAPVEGVSAASLPVETPDAEIGPVEAEARRHLAEVDCETSVLGQAALALARRLDGGRDTGTAMASLAKQLEATLSSATKGVALAADPLDELRARRDRKRTG
jgi:hypothetical protein